MLYSRTYNATRRFQMFKTITSLYLSVAIAYEYQIWALFIMQQIAFGVFLWFKRDDRWWLGCIPFANVFKKKELAGLGTTLCVLSAIFTFSALISMQLIPSFIALCLNTYYNWRFSNIYFNVKTAGMYTFIPFGKYVSYVREVRACRK